MEVTERTDVAVCRTSEVLRSYLTNVAGSSCVMKAVAAGLVTVVFVVGYPHVNVEVR